MAGLEKKMAKVAACYYGFSSNADGLPDGYEVTVTAEGESWKAEEVKEIKERLELLWPECVGHLSRTARLSQGDFAYHLNQLRCEKGASALSPTDASIEKIMRQLVGEGVVLVEVTRGKAIRRLLVNMALSA